MGGSGGCLGLMNVMEQLWVMDEGESKLISRGGRGSLYL